MFTEMSEKSCRPTVTVAQRPFNVSLSPERTGCRKKIEAIVRPEAVEEVKSALFAANVEGMTISQVQGAGNQHGWTEYYRGTEVLVRMRAKVKIEIVLPDERVDTVADIILAAARTGKEGEVGDGKIFIYPVEEAIRIHTGERGVEAILTSKVEQDAVTA